MFVDFELKRKVQYYYINYFHRKIFKIFKFHFMCIDILSTSIPLNQVQALCPPEARKRIEYSVTGVTDGYETLCGCRELNSCLWKEQL